ncbi:MAG: response regulator [Anaerolineae bacterium]|nr:response regulator [Anaerolineae bacterium]
MATEHQQTILIVEDDVNLSEMLNAYFNIQGYAVRTTSLGREALTLAYTQPPDLILLDINLPDVDGFEVCNQLHASHKTRHIPVIFLTEVREHPEKLYGLQLGVIDYITKPFDVQELRLRVRNTLNRAASAITKNPVTGLPEGGRIDKVLAGIVAGEYADCGVLTVTLLGLDAFRELYGFVASDDVLRVTSLTVASAVREVGGLDALCGHLDQHTFLIVLPSDRVEGFIQRITDHLGGLLEYFYPGDNRAPNTRTDDRLRLQIEHLDANSGSIMDIEVLKERVLSGTGSSSTRK